MRSEERKCQTWRWRRRRREDAKGERERERGPGKTHLSFGLKYFCLKGRAHKLESKGIRRERKGVERGKNSFEI